MSGSGAAAAAPPTPDPAPDFQAALVTLMRAHDSFGVWDRKSDDQILRRFVLSKAERRAIPVVGDPDPKVLWRLDVFYTAVGYAISRRTGVDAAAIVKISAEGFGRAVITVGRLVVLSRSLRDVHRFGFESIPALTAAGEAMVAAGLDLIERFPAVAREVP